MIQDLAEFEKLLKICRKQGVTNIALGGVSVTFGELPKKPKRDDSDQEIESDDISPEELAFYSAGVDQ